MNYKDITIIIVTFKSEKVIFDCLKSVKRVNNVIIVDNSNDKTLKKKILSKFPKIQIILSSENLGYGMGNNLALRRVKTKYALILNPDTILTSRCILELLILAKKLKNKFSIIAPSNASNIKNYRYYKKQAKDIKDYFKVDYVKGFAMFLNIKKVKKINFFDENFFMYLEEIDLCKRLSQISQDIYISNKAKIKHHGEKSSNIGFDFQLNRNWHWMWSKIYFSSKHNGFFMTRIISFPIILKLILQCMFNILFMKKNKFLIRTYRLWGLLSAYFGLKSFFRIKLS